MARKKLLKIFRGLKENLPLLSEGEPGFCLDTKELYIGTGSENVKINPYRQVLTLPAAGWTGNTNTISVPGITADMPPASFEVDLAGSVAEYNAAASAGLGNTDIIAGNGTITITAIGVIPTIDIGIAVTIYGGGV